MKNKLFVSFILVMLTSCFNKKQNVTRIRTDLFISEDFRLEIVILDSCEYYYGYLDNHSNVLTHKGNCKNPIHKHLDSLY